MEPPSSVIIIKGETSCIVPNSRSDRNTLCACECKAIYLLNMLGVLVLSNMIHPQKASIVVVDTSQSITVNVLGVHVTTPTMEVVCDWIMLLVHGQARHKPSVMPAGELNFIGTAVCVSPGGPVFCNIVCTE